MAGFASGLDRTGIMTVESHCRKISGIPKLGRRSYICIGIPTYIYKLACLDLRSAIKRPTMDRRQVIGPWKPVLPVYRLAVSEKDLEIETMK
jgi:hypothetical protein